MSGGQRNVATTRSPLPPIPFLRFQIPGGLPPAEDYSARFRLSTTEKPVGDFCVLQGLMDSKKHRSTSLQVWDINPLYLMYKKPALSTKSLFETLRLAFQSFFSARFGETFDFLREYQGFFLQFL